MNDKDKLAALDGLVLAEILAMTGDELRQAIADDEVEVFRRAFEAAETAAGKQRLALAKADLAAYRSGAKIVPMPSRGAGSGLSALRRHDAELDRKLTMAARNGKRDVEADAAGVDEDLAELEEWSKDGEDP